MDIAESLSSREIMDLLPHRYPTLYVDRIEKIELGQRIIGIKNVSINEPIFQGHFPEDPVLPNTILINAITQTAHILLVKESQYRGRKPTLVEIKKSLFHDVAVPGDQLRLEVEIKKIKDPLIHILGQVLVNGKVICECELMYKLSLMPSRPQIHPTASVHESAILGKDVIVGPYTRIGENVIIGNNTILESSIMVEKWTHIGNDCHIHFGAVIGSAPQDTSYKGEKSWVVIGDRNEIREYVTINRSTGKNAVTQIGNDNLFLTHVHIAHNCTLGNNIVITNMTNVAGHTHIEDDVTIGGMVGIHQFCRIGKASMIGGFSRIRQDIPPYMLYEGDSVRSINLIGLKRKDYKDSTLKQIKQIHKILYRSDQNTTQALKEINQIETSDPDIKHLITFINIKSKRGIAKKSV